MNAIFSFTGIYFNIKNRPHHILSKDEAKVNYIVDQEKHPAGQSGLKSNGLSLENQYNCQMNEIIWSKRISHIGGSASNVLKWKPLLWIAFVKGMMCTLTPPSLFLNFHFILEEVAEKFQLGLVSCFLSEKK